jgi:phage shock protein PspC (stress-responsive transcriptional regulator)
MPAKRKPKARKRKPVAKTRERTFEDGVENFAKEMESLGKRIEKKFDADECRMHSWFNTTFGAVGPLFSSLIGIALFAVFLWFLNLVNVPLGIGFLQNIHYFLMAHIGWFFLIFLFFSYTSYISGNFPKTYRPISPIITAAGITIAVWIAANVVRVVNISMGVDMLTSLASFLESNLALFFYLLTFLGYLILIAGMVAKGAKPVVQEKVKEIKNARMVVPAAATAARTRRIYRSGKDRILGGVCGGLAEYFGVDPVLIRIVWVVGTLAVWGTGILLYILLWIIVPRNPKHKWEE